MVGRLKRVWRTAAPRAPWAWKAITSPAERGAAEFYLTKGWKPVPVWPRSKKPIPED
jgi:hypothetical protein